MPVGHARGTGEEWVDNYQAGALAARLFDKGPQMDIGAKNIGAPRNDQFRVTELLRLHAIAGAECIGQAHRPRGCANCSIKP